MHAVLCFIDGGWGLLRRPFRIGDVLVTWPKALAHTVVSHEHLSRGELRSRAGRLNAAFPAYAPSGTSHKPTGA